MTSSRHGSARSRRARAGMTLIEIMVVILIIALASTAAVYGLGAVTQANLRSACMTINAASRGAYGRSIAEGTTVRLVFDLDADQSTMAFEEAHGRVTLTRTDDATRAQLEEGEDGTVVDPWAAAEARLSNTLHPTFGASPFSAIEGNRFRTRELPNGIRVVRVIVPHEPEPVEEGHAAIYFFPGGQTENAVVWVSDANDRVFSVEIHPLTGRGTVYDHAYEPEQLLDDGHGRQRSEVER
ncbi:MAG: prepilin-type N-terminal cleavage/methylation domain-containing protein [Sandaracinaceae bacterium]|nr:prepilin-type N-terminal cleavage/methylation domain-containing protein [Sandaracinaceae bacterium]